MSRDGFYDIDQSATFESWQENFIRYRAGLGFVDGPPERAVDKSKARSQNIKGLVLKTVIFTPSRINWALGTVPWPCPFRNRSMAAFFFFLEREMAGPVYDFRFQDEEQLEVEPPLTKARFASVDKRCDGPAGPQQGAEGYRQKTAKWLKIANEKEIECDFAMIAEVELGNVFDKCTGSSSTEWRGVLEKTQDKA